MKKFIFYQTTQSLDNTVVCQKWQPFHLRENIMANNNLQNIHPYNEISRYEPMRNLDDFFNNFRLSAPWSSWEPEPRIKIDVSESDDAYIVKADAPGVTKDDIKVTVEGNFVTIEFEVKKEENKEENGKVVRSERYYGMQTRSFALAQEVDESQASASYKDGVLELKLPKKPGAAKMQITIN